MTRKWYATLRHPKMYPHTKIEIPTSKNKGDMNRTRSGTDGLTDGQCDYYMSPKVPLGHKKEAPKYKGRQGNRKQEVFWPNIHVNTVYFAHSRRDIHLM